MKQCKDCNRRDVCLLMVSITGTTRTYDRCVDNNHKFYKRLWWKFWRPK